LFDNVATNTKVGHGLGIEFFLTYLFALTAFATAFGKHVWGNKAWIAIGFAIYLGNFVAGPFTGASLNPAVTYLTLPHLPTLIATHQIVPFLSVSLLIQCVMLCYVMSCLCSDRLVPLLFLDSTLINGFLWWRVPWLQFSRE
jgi:hypothetical protein